MRTNLSLLILVAASVVVTTACSGSGSGDAPPVSQSLALRRTSARTAGGAGDALARALIESHPAAPAPAAAAGFTMADGALAAELAQRAFDHLRASGLTAAGGPSQAGSARTRRRAKAPGAPIDANGNGTNLDEAMAAEVATLAAALGMPAPEVYGLAFPLVEGSADYQASVQGARGHDYARLMTVGPFSTKVSTAEIGAAMRARLAWARVALQDGLGPIAGSHDGVATLLLLSQVVAMEATVLRSLFHDGRAMGRVVPAGYDPTQSAKWLPGLFRFTGEAALPEAPANYFAVDASGTLAASASVLSAASELAWLVSDENPDFELRALLRGPLFSEPALPISATGGTALAATGAVPNWEDDVGPVLRYWCNGCHFDPVQYAFAQFSVETYEATLAGGINNATLNPCAFAPAARTFPCYRRAA